MKNRTKYFCRTYDNKILDNNMVAIWRSKNNEVKLCLGRSSEWENSILTNLEHNITLKQISRDEARKIRPEVFRKVK